jgi:hypothetical protein
MGKTICTGSVYTEDAALKWLEAHGARIEHGAHVDIICLPDTALVAQESHWWDNSIRFPGDESAYVSVELDIDSDETTLKLIDTSDDTEQKEDTNA